MPSGSEGSSPFSLMEMGTPQLRPSVATRGRCRSITPLVPDSLHRTVPNHIPYLWTRSTLRAQLRLITRCLDEVQREFVKSKEELGESTSVGSPFVQEIQDKQILLNFRLPTLEAYDDSSDLAEHVVAFRAQMALYGTFDALMCRAFPTTLRGLARI
ncbi:hypothetical protein BHM03_00040074, partial [Ensete ventricosum]